jgi:putative ABC transport system ATP-binding protein
VGADIARLLRHIATEEKRAVVIVSHDTRLREVADRIWLEDGAFRDLQTMSTDPIRGMSVDPKDAPHLQISDDMVVYFCSTACRDEYAGRKPGASRFPIRPFGGRTR